MSTLIRSRYVDAVPTLTIEPHPILATARRRMDAAAAAYLVVEDDALERPWPWTGDVDVRYGFYRGLEALERAAVAVGRTIDEVGAPTPPATRPMASAAAARWALHGRLVALTDADLDRDPGGGEWTIRQTVAHIINAQRAYGHFTAWWLSQRDVEPPPTEVAPDVEIDFPDETTEGEGTLAAIRARLDELTDYETSRFADLDDDALAAHARWSGASVDVAFRIGRWSSHLQEHTVQVDKTLDMLGWAPREVDRLVRLVYGAFGRLEGTIIGRPGETLDRAGADGRSPASIVDQASADLSDLATSVATAAGHAPAAV